MIASKQFSQQPDVGKSPVKWAFDGLVNVINIFYYYKETL